jgi:precorrin-2 dehydrogenase / sirohydrochlorin ferrochelatase
MLPLALDLARLPVAVVGRGTAARRRLALLDEAGARQVAVFSDAPDAELAQAAGDRLSRRLPEQDDLAGRALLLVCDLPRPLAARLAAEGHALKLLVNVEDDIALCDFHMPAIVRRGDLVLAISTGGKSPGLARALKQWLERLFDARWVERLQRLAHRRERWRASGRSARVVSLLTRRLIDRQGWLSEPRLSASPLRSGRPVDASATREPRAGRPRRSAAS